ncbi:hypothetical protein CROQUDRAFT_570195 [Cronartium quercuum f. sp. fusiforme G11]|uniref:Uncharacterized protein n=1 Tax=Cronartium quercuum f. sp. fusiforme G11 TaxID=708437 RepID=A0A9P6NVW8_9BASI|nr:hypothetical protein CROQUDRAFT_570195 [Cronartium quercuum f. sp. fusiforme G11]
MQVDAQHLPAFLSHNLCIQKDTWYDLRPTFALLLMSSRDPRKLFISRARSVRMNFMIMYFGLTSIKTVKPCRFPTFDFFFFSFFFLDRVVASSYFSYLPLLTRLKIKSVQ